MNNIVFLVQTNGIDYKHVDLIWDAALKYASAEEAVVIPFRDGLDNDFDPTGKYVIPYGSVRLSRIAKSEGWQGVYVNDNFDNSVWVRNRLDMLNQDVNFVPISELHRYLDYGEELFIRPSVDNKSFSAGSYDSERIKKLIKSAEMKENHGYGVDSMAAISTVKTLKTEYRAFIVGGKVITVSSYCHYGVPLSQSVDHRPEILDVTQRMADVWLPHPNCVMDIIYTDDGYKVVEFNALNSSGFYEHDVDAIVEALVKYTRQIES